MKSPIEYIIQVEEQKEYCQTEIIELREKLSELNLLNARLLCSSRVWNETNFTDMEQRSVSKNFRNSTTPEEIYKLMEVYLKNFSNKKK